MYGWGAAEVGKFTRVPGVHVSDDPITDETVTGDQVGSTTGGYALRRASVYGGVTPRFLPRNDVPLVSDDPTPPAKHTDAPPPNKTTPVVVNSSGGTQQTVVSTDDGSLPWWVWLGGAGVGAWLLFGKGKR